MKYISVRLVLFFIALINSFYSANSCAENTAVQDATLATPVKQTFVISYFQHPQIDKYLNIVEKSYNDIGINVSFVQIEGVRASKSVDRGLIDADLINDPFVAKSYQNMVAVGPSLTKASVFLLCKKGILCNTNVLTDSNQVVFTESSLTLSVKELLNVDIQAEIKVINNITNLLALVRRGRVDYIIFGLESSDIPSDISEHMQATYLYPLMTYHYVNIKHQAIIPKLSKAIKNNLTQH